MYTRFLWVHGRLLEPKADDRFASLRRDYDQYLIELRGLSASARSNHRHTVADFLVRGVGSRELSALTQGDVEAFVVLRGRELSRHSMQHRADLDLKRQALSQVFPEALAPPRGGHLLLDGRDLVGWLRRL